jgi:hypothetical protein
MKEKLKGLYKKHGKKFLIAYISWFTIKWIAIIFMGAKLTRIFG